jgi:hypothetical protein
MAAKKKAVKKTVAARGRSASKKSPRKIATKSTAQKWLRIGQRYPEHGGVFMGIALGENKRDQYQVFRGRYADRQMNHADALKFAADCTDGSHKDWQVPDRTDGALLYANGRGDMRSGWHWLKPQSALSGAYAWVQHFSHGNQGNDRKSNEFEVVLVRRVPI